MNKRFLTLILVVVLAVPILLVSGFLSTSDVSLGTASAAGDVLDAVEAILGDVYEEASPSVVNIQVVQSLEGLPSGHPDIPGAPAVTPTPAKTRRALTLATNTPLPQPSPTPTLTAMPPVTVSPTAVTPSPTPLPPTETPPPSPSDTPAPPPPAETATPLPTVEPSSPPPATATPTVITRPPLPPQEGGEWGMEAGFVPGSSPLGEDCPGWSVATGWTAFLAPGTPASSCFNENKNLDNVHSGERSQEITFDFVSAEAGIAKQAQTIPGHRYQIEAWGKHVQSESPVELSLGVDLTGGENWQAASVAWHPWDETGESIWVHTQVTVRASGASLTVFLKGYHPYAVKGGATLFDDVRVVDLGP